MNTVVHFPAFRALTFLREDSATFLALRFFAIALPGSRPPSSPQASVLNECPFRAHPRRSEC
jgi:hypothetical protein